MRTESDLLHLLSDEPPTPSAVDVGTAIVTGRRRRTTRRAVHAATGAAVAVAAILAGGALVSPGTAPTEVTGPVSCAVRLLATPDGVPSAMVLASDRTGRLLAGRTEPAGDPVLWQNGIPRRLDFPGSGRSALTGVNSSGTAIGWGYAEDEDKAPRPYVYRQGSFTYLQGESGGHPAAINDAGAIAGESAGSAVWWPSATAAPIRLPVPEGTGPSSATGIDEDGTVVGRAGWRTFAWLPDGTRRELPAQTIGGVAATVTTPGTISNGWVIGTVSTGTPSRVDSSAGFRWNLATGEVQLSDESRLQIGAATGDGRLIGTDPEHGTSVLVTGTTTRPLPLPEGAMPLAAPAYTTSIDARIVTGHVVDTTGAVRPVLWTCG